MEVSPNSFISDDLKELFADVVYTCKLKSGQEAFCTIIIEHKSYKDAKAIFQMGSYIFAAYKAKNPENNNFKVVIPVLFYNNENTWEVKSVEDFFIDLPKPLKRFLPTFDLIVVEVKKMSDENIFNIRNLAILSLLLTQKHFRDPLYLFKQLNRILES